MELRHLRYFIAVAQHLNFSEASRRLHVAQPAISQTILDLEEELDVKLLLRTRRKVELTTAGNAFLSEAVEIVRRSERAKTIAQRVGGGEVGYLNIGFMPSATAPFLPGLIAAYKRRFPNVEMLLYEMSPTQQLKALDERRIDIGFTRSVPSQRTKEFNSEKVYDDRLEIALPLAHPIAREQMVELKTLARERFVEFHRHGAPGLFDEVISTCRLAGFSPNVICEPDLMSSVMLFVESGLCISLVPGCVRNLNHPNAVFRPIKPSSARIPLCAVWAKDLHEPVLECFLEVLRSTKTDIKERMERGSSSARQVSN
jgi:DNA-binding transcriptional LysR family regulator